MKIAIRCLRRKVNFTGGSSSPFTNNIRSSKKKEESVQPKWLTDPNNEVEGFSLSSLHKRKEKLAVMS